MAVEGKRKIASVLCLFWIVTAAISHFLHDTGLPSDLVLISFFFLILGLVISVGQFRFLICFFFPFIFMPKDDLSKYNVEKILSVLGAVIVVMSSVIFVLAFSTDLFAILVFVLVAAAAECVVIYTAVAKRFRADTRPKY